MRKNIKHQFIWIPFFVLLLFNSCEAKDGDWDDNIKLSSRQVQFESKGGSAIVTTKGTGWWFSDIYPSADSIQHTSFDTLNGGKQIDGERYIFDSRGYALQSAWYYDEGYKAWYYFDENCKMVKGDKDKPLWKWIDGGCYAFGEDGRMYRNCVTPDRFCVDESGAWIK